jgi:hypothetical protein
MLRKRKPTRIFALAQAVEMRLVHGRRLRAGTTQWKRGVHTDVAEFNAGVTTAVTVTQVRRV